MAGPLARWRRRTHWEFWPAWIFYTPVALNCLRLAAKHGGLALPTCANPGMHLGGMIGESKHAVLDALRAAHPEFVPASFLLAGPDRAEFLGRLVAEGRLRYPFVLKPDVAQRGSGFKLAGTAADSADYLHKVPVPVVAQRYVPGPREAGVFYYRFPHEERGHILGITDKVFPSVTGDGRRTLEQLVTADPRACAIADTYLRRFRTRRGEILPEGESLRLVEAGNHIQGCIFRDGSHLQTDALAASIDRISRSLDGFHIGRYDVRYESPEDLMAGQNFQVLELNGASSEATNAYDARHTVRQAYGILFRQWELVFAIGAANHQRGRQPDGVLDVWREWRKYRRCSACHPAAD